MLYDFYEVHAAVSFLTLCPLSYWSHDSHGVHVAVSFLTLCPLSYWSLFAQQPAAVMVLPPIEELSEPGSQ